MAGGKRGRFLRRVREGELPSRVKEAGLGHDSVPASQGASFHRGFRRLRAATYFAHGGKVGKTPPGTAPDEHFVLIVAFPRTPFTGVTPWAGRKTSGAQNLSGGLRFLPGHWALALREIGAGAVSQPRLALPNQRYRFRNTGYLIRPLRGHLPLKGKALKAYLPAFPFRGKWLAVRPDG